MSESSPRRAFAKRLFIAAAALTAFTMASIIGARLAVESLFKGIASSRSSGLSALTWDTGSMLHSYQATAGSYDKSGIEPWIARNANVLAHSSDYDRSLASLHQIVTTHHGYLEDLRTESHSGRGRALASIISVPSNEFDATLAELKTLGRVEGISESGEDFAVKLAAAARHLSAAQTTLSRLQKLQRERKGELRDAVALEKDIAQATEAVDDAERANHALVSTVAQAHLGFTLLEDYRAPLQTNLAGVGLQLRNSMVEGIASIFSSIALVLGVFLEFGLPILFWGALLFVPTRFAWRRFRRTSNAIPATP
jgi:hypothetical protein